MEIAQITKRDFSTVPFQLFKITNAVFKAMTAVEHGQISDAKAIANEVHNELLERKRLDAKYIPTVEEVQDVVEQKLMISEFQDVAKAYIIYREKASTEQAV